MKISPALKRVYSHHCTPNSLRPAIALLLSGKAADCQALPLSQLAQAFSYYDSENIIKNTAFQVAAQIISSQYAERPLQKDSKLCLWGVQNLPIGELRSHLHALGVQLVEQATESTHILLGLGLKNNQCESIETLEKAGKQFIQQPQLLAFLQSQEQFYLQPNDPKAAEEAAEVLHSLLRSGDKSNTALALQMMQTGGVPKSVLVPLFALASTLTPLRKEARQLLQRYGSDAQYLAAQNFSSPITNGSLNARFWSEVLVNGYFSWQEIYEYETLYTQNRQTPEFWLHFIDDADFLKAYLQQYFKQNPSYLFRPQHQESIQARWMHCPEITRLAISINANKIPDYLRNMRQIQALYCSLDRHSSPSALAALKSLSQLAQLSLSFKGRISSLPAALFFMPKLQRIEIFGALGFEPQSLPAHFSCSLLTPTQGHFLLIRHSPS